MIYLYEAFKSVIPIFIIIGIIIFLIVFAVDFKFKVEQTVPRQLAKIVIHYGFIMSFIGIVLVTGLPSDHPEKITQFEPFQSIIDTYRYATPYAFFNAIVMNVILFIPFSLFLYLISKRLIITVLISFFFSFFIEVMQYILPIGRISNLDDVILNATGAIIGCLTGLVLRGLVTLGQLSKKQDKGVKPHENFR